MTICLKCKHVRKAIRWTRNWVVLGCAKHPIATCQNPVTGETEPAETGIIIKRKAYKYCRYVNNGECPDYEAK